LQRNKKGLALLASPLLHIAWTNPLYAVLFAC
jgi:hypothetical protein